MPNVLKCIKAYFKLNFVNSFHQLSKEEKNKIVEGYNEKIKHVFCYIHNHSPKCRLLSNGKIYFNSCCFEQSREIEGAINKS